MTNKEIKLLGVACDGEDLANPEGECFNNFEADVVVRSRDDQATRYGYIIKLAQEQGWAVVGGDHPLTALTFCPDHKAQARQVHETLQAIRDTLDS